MNIRKAVRDFITAREVENVSANTITNYRRNLGYFVDWVESSCNVFDTDGLQLSHLRGWVNYLQKKQSRYGKPLSDSTIHQYGLDLLIFCHWLEQEEILQKPISERFKLPKIEEKFVPTFTPDDVQKLLVACDEGGRTKPHLRKALTARNRAIVSVLIDTGIRRKELGALRLCDVDRNARVLTIHRKGNKWQQVPISRDGFKPLHEYLTKYRPVLALESGRTVARKDDAVFLSFMGEALSLGGISALFERICKRSGIEDKRVSPHNCRRYMATSQLAMGRSPLEVQRQMGHTTLQMTNRYLSMNVQQLQKSHEEYSPLRQRSAKEQGSTGKEEYWDE